MDPIAAAAWAVLDRRLDPGETGPVVIALSGGGDSVALLWLAAAWGQARGRDLLALTVDHGLNPASAAWTGAAGEAAHRAGAAWRALVWTGAKPAAGLPAAARAARHRLLAEAARQAGAKVLLIAHTRDDVLEGEVMRRVDAPTLGRLREWSPSPAWPEGRGLFLLRPLLDQRRAGLRAWLAGRGEPWLDDPANEDPRFARTRARLRLHEGTDASSDPETLSPTSADWDVSSDGRILLPMKALGASLLAKALLCAAGTDRPPRGSSLARLLRLLLDGRGQATLAGARIVADGHTVQIGRDAGERLRGRMAPAVCDGAMVWDGRFHVAADEPGWTVQPLAGLIGRLPAADRAGLVTIPAWARGALPVLTDSGANVRLPRPFGTGPGEARSLAAARLAGACGLIAREGQITDSRHSARGSLTLCSVQLK